MGKIIGITGSSGTIGKILYKKLIDMGFKLSLFEGDIRNKNDIMKWVNFNKLDIIFHLAAIVPVDEVKKDPFEAYNVNVGGTINLLDSLKKLQIYPWIFYASTSHVYKPKDSPIKEEDDVQPLNIYGETKYFAERICESFSESYKCKICIGRIFSFYHKTQKPPFLYPTIIERLRKEDPKKPFFIRGANNIRDFLNAEDVVLIMIKLMEKGYSGTINIGSGKGITIETFVKKYIDQSLNIYTNNKEEKSILIADITKLKNIIGII